MKWVFFIAFPACILGLNLFLAWAVWRFFAPHKRAQFIGAGAVLGMLLIFALSFLGFLMHAQSNAFFAFAWEFLAFAVVPMIYLALWALAGTLAWKIFPKLARFKNAFAGIGVALVVLVCAYGFWKFENPRVTYLVWNPATRKLSEFSGPLKLQTRMRIVATADWHLGTRIHRARTEKFVRLVNEQHPDLVLIAGDLIDGHIEPVEAARLEEVLQEIRAPLGVFFRTRQPRVFRRYAPSKSIF